MKNKIKEFVYPKGHSWEGLTPNQVNKAYENKENKISEKIEELEKGYGCNKNLGRGLCGEISFANKIILCDDCVFELIQKYEQAEKETDEKVEEFTRWLKGRRIINPDVVLVRFNKIFKNQSPRVTDNSNSVLSRLTEGSQKTEDTHNQVHVSFCCKAPMKKDSSDEGTFTMVCSKCGRDCNPILKNQGEER